MTPSRIAYVVSVFPKLSETFIAGELAELRRRGVELCVLSLRQPAERVRHEFTTRAELDKITCYDPAKFSAILREFRPQLLHAHFATKALATARELAKELGLPFTFTAHGYDIRRKAPPDFAQRAAAARAIITVSKANARYIAARFRVPFERIHVIPCGVDTDRFHPPKVGGSEGQNPSLSSRTPQIVCVARHVQVKNLGLLLEACAVLRDRGERFRCVMIGDGPLRGELEEICQRIDLQEIVVFAGALEQAQVLEWWQRASVAVLTSENEGMPVSLMEAAACGVPAVATEVGGVPELIENGVTGLLVPPGDTVALADSIQTLLQDPSLALRMGVAARRRAEEHFSVRRQVDRLQALWSELLIATGGSAFLDEAVGGATAGALSGIVVGRIPSMTVVDQFGAASDPELPTVALALDPEQVHKEFKHGLPRLTGEQGIVRVKSITIMRHKPGKRCLIEYDVRIKLLDGSRQRAKLLGKVRARRSGKGGYRMLDAVWNAGFNPSSSDGISVPEPVGIIPKFRMWLQRKVPGIEATALLLEPSGVALARRCAEAIHKLHTAGVPTERTHSMADEMRILHEHLPRVAETRPELGSRITRLLEACDRLGAAVPTPRQCGIHRDFYPEQVMVDGARLYLLDFDLYCQGDPALDVGNFLGHLIEISLRYFGDAQASVDRKRAMEERFVELAGASTRPAIKAYTLLTLVRHIYLSSQFPERKALTEPLLALCEQRLDLRT
ncbi:MAG: hypothetical protein DME26_06370 [Verrucomicrobia bacterium]|nr:MAG: hypothetical protein DME26_06370 [Verrucomicrobiota bacterium]